MIAPHKSEPIRPILAAYLASFAGSSAVAQAEQCLARLTRRNPEQELAA